MRSHGGAHDPYPFHADIFPMVDLIPKIEMTTSGKEEEEKKYIYI